MTNYSLIYVKLFYTGLSISFQLHYLQLQHISRLPKSFLHSYMYTFAALKTGNVLLRKCLISRFKTKILSSSIKNSYTKALLWWTFTVIAVRVFYFFFRCSLVCFSFSLFSINCSRQCPDAHKIKTRVIKQIKSE